MTDLRVPVDDSSLNLLEQALEYYLDFAGPGEDPVGVGEFSLHDLLNFWSGYDPGKLIPIAEDASLYTGVIISPNDVIKALIDEVRRLRAEADHE